MTITTNVTLHVPGKDHKPFVNDAAGSRIGGHYQADILPPGTEVTLDEDEARTILKRFGGTVIASDGSKTAVDAAAAPAPKVTTEPGKQAVKG